MSLIQFISRGFLVSFHSLAILLFDRDHAFVFKSLDNDTVIKIAQRAVKKTNAYNIHIVKLKLALAHVFSLSTFLAREIRFAFANPLPLFSMHIHAFSPSVSSHHSLSLSLLLHWLLFTRRGVYMVLAPIALCVYKLYALQINLFPNFPFQCAT